MTRAPQLLTLPAQAFHLEFHHIADREVREPAGQRDSLWRARVDDVAIR